MSSRSRRQAPQQQPAAAEPQSATTTAAVSPQLRVEDVWRFLLELWEPCLLDQRVVCKLLCVSKSMERLVHSLCAGKLSVVMQPVDDSSSNSSSPGGARISWPSRVGPYRWLAKHMRLLHSCTIPYDRNAQPATTFDEGLVGTALVAAAGGSFGVARSTRAQAAAGAAAITAAAASAPTAAAAAAGMGAPQALQHLTFLPPTRGSIVCSLSATGSVQLTSLQLCLSRGTPPTGLQQALTSLSDLRALTVRRDRLAGREDVFKCRPFGKVLDGLQELQSLTKLDLAGFDLYDMPSWPRHLESLRFTWPSADLQLDHLSHLTSLQLCDTTEGLRTDYRLPPNLQQLLVQVNYPCSNLGTYSLQPLVPLQSLTRLDYLLKRPAAHLLQQLAAMPQLQELHLGADLADGFYGELEPCGWEHLPALPLKSLSFTDSCYEPMPPGVFGVLGTCTQLTRLECVFVNPDPAPSRVALLCGQLSSLPALEVLSVAAKGSYSPLSVPAAGAWEALAHACPQLSALRHLSLQSLALAADAAASLAAATQLTRLQLTHCGLDAAAQAALRAGLQGRVELHSWCFWCRSRSRREQCACHHCHAQG